MANNYLQFSEVIPRLTSNEETWLRRQLERVCVFGDREYAEHTLPEGFRAADADWVGYRMLHGWERSDPDDLQSLGFVPQFDDDGDHPDGFGRHLWLYAGEYGDPERAAYLVQQFLQKFRPDDCWSFCFAVSCSKPRVGEFSGGGAFVTADRIVWYDAHDCVAQERERWAENRKRQQDVDRLIKHVEQGGLGPDDLDELVHDTASAASSANNCGLAGQVEYLVRELGAAQAEKALVALLVEHRPPAGETP